LNRRESSRGIYNYVAPRALGKLQTAREDARPTGRNGVEEVEAVALVEADEGRRQRVNELGEVR